MADSGDEVRFGGIRIRRLASDRWEYRHPSGVKTTVSAKRLAAQRQALAAAVVEAQKALDEHDRMVQRLAGLSLRKVETGNV